MGTLKVVLMLSIAYLQTLTLELLSLNSVLFFPIFVQSLIVWDFFPMPCFNFHLGFSYYSDFRLDS